METKKREPRGLPFNLVLTVPMRNGNILGYASKTWSRSVLTVPMRNGNNAILSIVWSMGGGSYRTYEEWKLDKEKMRIRKFSSSYRTYEEWKHNGVVYEFIFVDVLTVPMRNGNFELMKENPDSKTVLTVPMRNGNLYPYIRPTIASLVLTVPMRNGNYLCKFSQLSSQP